MKKQEREVYINLTYEVDTVLCYLCTSGKGGDCDNMPTCEHPLQAVRNIFDNIYGITPGDDCWGFRPQYNRETCVDMVGCWLQGKLAEVIML